MVRTNHIFKLKIYWSFELPFSNGGAMHETNKLKIKNAYHLHL